MPVAFIAENPRRKGRACKIESNKRLKKERYVVEQFNGHLKANLLKKCWIRPRGLIKKTAMVTAGLISYNIEAIRSLLVGDKSLKTISKYWHNTINLAIEHPEVARHPINSVSVLNPERLNPKQTIANNR